MERLPNPANIHSTYQADETKHVPQADPNTYSDLHGTCPFSCGGTATQGAASANMSQADWWLYFHHHRQQGLTKPQISANWGAVGDWNAKHAATAQIRNNAQLALQLQQAQQDVQAQLQAQAQQHVQHQAQQNFQAHQQAQAHEFARAQVQEQIHQLEDQVKQAQTTQQAQAEKLAQAQAQTASLQAQLMLGDDTDDDSQFSVDETTTAVASSQDQGGLSDESRLLPKNLKAYRQAALVCTGSKTLEGNWKGGWLLTGGRSPLAFWVQEDDHGLISDRVVMKDTYMPTDEWMHANKWVGNVRSTKRRPMEYTVQRRLNKSRPEQFAGVRKCKVYHRKMMHRMYLDYCSFANGWALIERYKDRGVCIPEPMLWCVFEMLTDAALVMERGSLTARQKGWREVVHRDMKPDNVFFDHPTRDTRYPAYATPVLGDFGAAIQTSVDDPFNPSAYYEEAGAQPYLAPETKQYFEMKQWQNVDGDKILAPTNVWGIGATMLSFMDRSWIKPGQYDYLDPDNCEPKLRKDAAKDLYGTEIVAFVAECVRFKPADRITLPELRERLLHYTDDNDEDGKRLALGMRSWRKSVDPKDPCFVEFKDDTYKLGMAVAGLKDAFSP